MTVELRDRRLGGLTPDREVIAAFLARRPALLYVLPAVGADPPSASSHEPEDREGDEPDEPEDKDERDADPRANIARGVKRVLALLAREEVILHTVPDVGLA